MRLNVPALVLGGGLILGLLIVHLIATRGTGTFAGSARDAVAITPRTTLTHAWRHLYAGFFHNSWGHLAYNLTLFAVGWVFATQDRAPWGTAATMYVTGPLVVFLLHLVLVRPLAAAGNPYAVRAMDVPLVGFSVMMFSVVGMALARLPLAWGLASLGGLAAYEVVLAFYVTTPFVFAYHLAGLLVGFAARRILG